MALKGAASDGGGRVGLVTYPLHQVAACRMQGRHSQETDDQTGRRQGRRRGGAMASSWPGRLCMRRKTRESTTPARLQRISASHGSHCTLHIDLRGMPIVGPHRGVLWDKGCILPNDRMSTTIMEQMHNLIRR